MNEGETCDKCGKVLDDEWWAEWDNVHETYHHLCIRCGNDGWDARDVAWSGQA